jgi:hypothetical protein
LKAEIEDIILGIYLKATYVLIAGCMCVLLKESPMALYIEIIISH